MFGIIAASRLRNKPSIGILQVKSINNILLGGIVDYTFSFDNPPNPNSKVLIFVGSDLGGRTATIPNTLILLDTTSARTGRVFQPNTPLQTYTMTTSANGRFWIYMLELENCDVITGVGFTPSLVTNTITSVSSNVLKDDTLITIYNSAPTPKPSIVANNGFNIITPTSDFVVEGFIRLYDNEFLNQTTDLSYIESDTAIRLFTVRLMKNYTQFLPETQAIVNRAILEGFTLPDQFKLNCIDRLIREMKLSGYWQKRDLILNYAYNDDAVEDFTRINWKDPSGVLTDHIKTNKYNLCGPTEDFSSSAWGKVGTGAQINSNVAIAPDGNMTADRWTNGTRLQQSVGNNVIISETYNWSVYGKADSGNLLRLHITANIPTGNAVFDLSTGVIVSTGGNVISASISNEGSGWYRCSIAYTPVGGEVALNSFNSGESIFIWGAQLTRGATLQPYQPISGNRGLLLYDNEGSIGPVANFEDYIDTNFNTSVNGLTYTLDEASRDAVLFNTLAVTPFIISGVDGSATIDSWRRTNSVVNRINQAGNVNLNSAFDLGGQGYKGINRINSTTVTLINKNVIGDRTANSSALANAKHFLHKSGGFTSDNIISFFSMGASVVSESQNFRTAYNTYLTSIGLSPIA
jgi:hypothetical protein